MITSEVPQRKCGTSSLCIGCLLDRIITLHIAMQIHVQITFKVQAVQVLGLWPKYAQVHSQNKKAGQLSYPEDFLAEFITDVNYSVK